MKFKTKQECAFFARNKMLSHLEVHKLMGLADSNVNRAIIRQIENNCLIALGSCNAIPAFQFKSNGSLYPDLVYALDAVKKRGILVWDFCYWLTGELTEILRVPPVTNSLKGASISSVFKMIQIRDVGTVAFSGKPIDALLNDDQDTFRKLFNKWLNNDSFLAIF